MYFENDPRNLFKSSIAVWDHKKPKSVVPSILISEKDGLLFKRLAQEGQRVVLSIDIDSTVDKSDSVTLEYYIMVNDPLSYHLLHKILAFRFASYGLLQFKPIYTFKDLTSDALGATSNCFNGNRYCIHAEKNQPYKTDEYREETIRQLCLWEETKHNSNLEREWWKYMTSFEKLCLTKTGIESLKDCSDTAFNRGEVDPHVVTETRRCFNRHYNEQEQMSIIDDQMKDSYDFEQYPGILVNNNLIRGFRSQKSIVTSVCDAYIHKPAACMEYDLHITPYSYARNTSFWHVYGLMILCVLLLTSLTLLLKNCINTAVSTDVEEGVRDHVHTYYRINETDRKMKDTELRPDETTG